MQKKKAPERGKHTRSGASNVPPRQSRNGEDNTKGTAKVNPLELPQFASLAPLRSRLIPLCRPNGSPEQCTCPHHKGKHDPKSTGKVPIESDWQRNTHLPHWPSYEYNVGVRLGRGVNVLDDDPRNRGGRPIASVLPSGATLPRGPRVATGGGGYHHYFKAPVDQASWSTPGLELKANGSQVVAPGSLHASGKLYVWEVSPDEAELPDLPDWLKTRPNARLKLVEADPRQDCWTGELLQWGGEQWTKNELEKRARLYLRSLPVERNAGNSWAFRVANVLLRGFMFKRQDALKLYREWNTECVSPPWATSEINHKLDEAEKSHTFSWGYLLKGDRVPPPFEEPDESQTEAELEAADATEEETPEDEEAPGTSKGKSDERLVFVVSQNKFYSFPEGVFDTAHSRDQGLIGLELPAAIAALQAMGTGFRSAALICKQKRCVIVEDTRRWPTNERVIEQKGKKYLNTFWRLMPPPEKGPCPNLDALVAAIGGDAQGAEWLWNWAGYVVQNPHILPGVCVVARGDPGVGKSKLGEAIGLCRGVYASVTNSAFHSEFNSRWADARFINAAEVMLADARKEDNQRFLSLITDPEIEFHKKNVSAYEIPNRIAWWLTSNLDNPVLVPRGDRRFTILDASSPSDGIMESLKKDWKHYEGRYDEWPELQAFRYKLLHAKVDEPKARRPLLNEAHAEVQEASRGGVEAFCDEVELNGFHPLAARYIHLQGTVTEEGAAPGHILVDPAYLHRLFAAWCKDAGVGVTGYMRFACSGALRKFPKHPQCRIKNVLYRLREIPAGHRPD